MIKKGQLTTHKHKVATAAAAVALALMGQSVQAVDLSSGDWSINLDTTVSYGVSVRVEDRDEDKIGHSNLAELEGQPFTAAYLARGAWSNNGDDGNLNFDKGDIFSHVVKITPELSIHNDNWGMGLFVRASGFYDFALMQGDFDGRGQKGISQKGLDEQGKQSLKLLDFFIYKTFDFAESSAQIRLGEQVISWGESTFIQHGLSEINAVDVTKLRVPGSEIKEGLIPVRTAWGQIDLTDSLSLEGYIQYEWQPFRTDEPGTYFATQDFTGLSGTDIHLGFSTVPEGTPGTIARRLADHDASDKGQFGVKLGWYSEALGDTDFGFYFVNYHSKRPLISAYAHNGVEVTGFFEYPEDIQMYGISFNTSTDGGVSIAGELTYRQDEPIQVDDVELLFATLEPVGSVPSGTSQIPGGALPGEEISGYRLFDTVQAQATFTTFLGPRMGANQWTLLAEVGANWILDMPPQSVLRFNAPGTNRSGNPARAAFEGVETNPFADDFSWGYRLVTKLDYNDVFWGINLFPRIVFQHDVDGITPGPISNFVEGRKAVTFGVGADYRSTWKADLGYSVFTGGGASNVLSDRDFVAFNISYSF